ncbi:MAG: methylmalonyl-CoA carboxyltransferase, partial [Mailhella sp.]|nr:methylmalonyl-CoA carboxyltransferase [Mailhella sp.]
PALTDFIMMAKNTSYMFITGPKVVKTVTGETVSVEELGGANVHATKSGVCSFAVDTEDEGIAMIRQLLSYLPSNNKQPAPRVAVPEGSDEACKDMLDIIPEEQNRVYDMKKVIKAIVDKDSFFELKPKWGRGMVTALARIDGRSVGIIANNPIWKGGAMDADGCEKATGFIVLCDSFNIPIILMEDQPGFLIGIEGEKRKMPGRIINWMNAIGFATVPKICLQVRKAYGQGFLNMGGAQTADEVCAWFTSETSFMAPEAAVGVVLGLKREEDPEKYDSTLADLKKSVGCYEYARVFGCQEVIDPRESRDYLKKILDVYTPEGGIISEHKLSTWPTTY